MTETVACEKSAFVSVCKDQRVGMKGGRHITRGRPGHSRHGGRGRRLGLDDIDRVGLRVASVRRRDIAHPHRPGRRIEQPAPVADVVAGQVVGVEHVAIDGRNAGNPEVQIGMRRTVVTRGRVVNPRSRGRMVQLLVALIIRAACWAFAFSVASRVIPPGSPAIQR